GDYYNPKRDVASLLEQSLEKTAKVFYGITNVNERMVTLGHAWVMRRYYGHLSNKRKNQLNRLERWAKLKKVGLWKQLNPIPPWKWRHSA
ncbi:MAG: hypothetical protein COB77_06505, partial [Gammaproteobacteria bacterium]